MTDAAFWTRIAPKYALRPVSDEAAYDDKLARTRRYLKPSDRVLEVGCGTGTTALRLAPSVAQYTGTDIAEGMIRIARDKLGGDAPQNLSFRTEDVAGNGDGPYDVILAFNMLHLVPDVPGDLAALAARLKPGGLLISKSAAIGDVGIWMDWMIRAMRAVGKAPFCNRFTSDDLMAMIRAAGFEILDTHVYGKTPPSPFVVARKI